MVRIVGRWFERREHYHPTVKMTVGQSRLTGAACLVAAVGWIFWEESAKAGYLAPPPVTGLAPFLMAIGVTLAFFYPRTLTGR
jgi:hypothetical protein